MRYTSKIYVMDVLDQVVVSGYVVADPGTGAEPDPPFEFTYTSTGRGIDDPQAWLRWHLYEALQHGHTPTPSRGE